MRRHFDLDLGSASNEREPKLRFLSSLRLTSMFGVSASSTCSLGPKDEARTASSNVFRLCSHGQDHISRQSPNDTVTHRSRPGPGPKSFFSDRGYILGLKFAGMV